jgi:hypothetical protein
VRKDRPLLRFSPADLINFMGSEFVTWMERFYKETPGAIEPEALDLALTTLRSLQHGGRLVRIISHAPEPKQKFDVRLDVIAQKRGSTARLTVPGGGSLLESVSVSD